MSAQDPLPRLHIDEEELDFGHAWIHPRDPDPGGHRYRLWLPASLAKLWRSSPRQGLQGLNDCLTIWRMQQGIRQAKPWLYVLNTIDAVIQLEDGIEIRGVCSPFLRG